MTAPGTAGHKPQPKNRQSTLREFLMFMSIPISIMLIVIGAIVLPSLFARPSYDFVYSYCPSYACANQYRISGDGVISESDPVTVSNGYNYDSSYRSATAELYYHSISKNSSKRIEVAAANKYTYDTANVSPDGYRLKQGSDSDGGFLFWGSSYDSNWYLKNGSKKKSLNLVEQNDYSGNITLLGWVKQ